ncbi:MAG: hypothetical protein ACK50Q_08525 [Labrys sp. (in: a-proteobacteria)]
MSADGTRLTLVLPAGQAGVTVLVDVLNDGLVEINDETIAVDIVDVANAVSPITVVDARGLALDPDPVDSSGAEHVAQAEALDTLAAVEVGLTASTPTPLLAADPSLASLLDGPDATVGLAVQGLTSLLSSGSAPMREERLMLSLLDNAATDVDFGTTTSADTATTHHGPALVPEPSPAAGPSGLSLYDVFTDAGEIDLGAASAGLSPITETASNFDALHFDFGQEAAPPAFSTADVNHYPLLHSSSLVV